MATYDYQSDDDDSNLHLKFILVGDSGVGKSSILLKYTTNQFRKEYSVTIGVEFGSKTIQLDRDTTIKLQIWDTAGQESFRAIVRSFYRNAAVVFLVYDVNKIMIYNERKESFFNLESWLKEIRTNSDDSAILVLMGNKVDSTDSNRREVSYRDGERFMEENQLSFFFETSAVNGQNIEKAFIEATKLAVLRSINHSRRQSSNLKDTRSGTRISFTDDGKNKKGGCC